jgi:alpha-glucuronidase
LRYKIIDDPKLLYSYKNTISATNINASSPTLLAAKEELENGLKGFVRKIIPAQTSLQNGAILAGTASRSSIIRQLISSNQLAAAGKEGFIIRSAIYQGKKDDHYYRE